MKNTTIHSSRTGHLDDSFTRLLETTTGLFKVEARETLRSMLATLKKKFLVPALFIPALLFWAALAAYDLFASFMLYFFATQFPGRSEPFHRIASHSTMLLLIFGAIFGVYILSKRRAAPAESDT